MKLNNSSSLKKLINKHKIILSVYGLGNVGGPIAAAWLRKNAKIIGVDISKKLLNQIKENDSHKHEPFLSDIFSKSLSNGCLELTTDGIHASKKSMIKIVAVPVAIKNKKIDLSIIKKVITNISKGLKKGDSIIICPSLPPGTCEKILLPILEKNSKLKCERDFNLIYNPERIFEGRALQDIEENYPAIVSGIGRKSLSFAEKLLKIISKKGVISMSTISAAESEKLFEGVYRDVNIALANELSNFCKHTETNYWEIIKAANSQPFCHLHYPGTGVGGLCIPVYPQFIINSAKKHNISTELIEFAREINDTMPIKCAKDSLKLIKKSKHKKNKIAVLGLGFRGDVYDSRLSPTFSVVNTFLKNGFNVAVHDPFIKDENLLPKNVELSKNLSRIVKDASLIFVATDHKEYKKLTKKQLLNPKKPIPIFDGRNILNKKNFSDVKLVTVGINN